MFSKKIFFTASFILLFSCTSLLPTSTKYPSHWWKTVEKSTAPAWEILPQEAKPGEVILSKRNELGILSNFTLAPFKLDGTTYQSIEGFWQMMLYPETKDDLRYNKKVTWKYTRQEVSQMVAFEAKMAGDLAENNMKILGIDWVTYQGKKFLYRSSKPLEHYELIKRAMMAKLEQNPKVKDILLKTYPLVLKPDHHGEINAPKEWEYYNIWMEFRDQLKI